MAIGIGFTPVGQPTVQPEWFKPPVELMANALMSKEKHYAYNRSLLDSYEQTQNALQSMPGKSKAAHTSLQEKWKGMQQDIIDKTGGDLAKADDLLRAYQETLIQDFSGTGLAGVLSSNYENYKNILKQADEMKAKGLYNEAQYWYVVTKAFKEFDDAGGVLGGDEDTGEYKSFYSEPLNPNIDIEEDALKVVKDWLPDSEYKDISELKGETVTVSSRSVNGYNIYATEDGTEYVDFEEVYTALLKSYSGNEKVQQQIKVQYLYDENFNLLRGEYKQTVEQRLNNYNTELNDHTNIFSQLEKLQSSKNVKEIQQFLKETYGSDFSIYNITHLQEYIKQYKDKELKSINNIKENIEVINDRLEKESREDLSRSLNLFDYSQDKIKEKIFLASTKSSYKKEFKKVQWLQEPKEDKPSVGGKGGGADEDVVTETKLVTTTTGGLKASQKEYDKYKESILNSEGTKLSNIKDIMRTEFIKTPDTPIGDISNVLTNLTEVNYYKYLDIDGDFDYNKFIDDFSKDGFMLDKDGKKTQFTKDFFRTTLKSLSYQINGESRAFLAARNERLRFQAAERIKEIQFINSQGGDVEAIGSKNIDNILKLDVFKKIIESGESEDNLRDELEALKILYEEFEFQFDPEYTFIDFLGEWANLGVKETEKVRREVLKPKAVEASGVGSTGYGLNPTKITKYDYNGTPEPVWEKPKYNITEDVNFGKVLIPASKINKILNDYTPISLVKNNKTNKYYVRSSWSTSDPLAHDNSYNDKSHKKPTRNNILGSFGVNYFKNLKKEYDKRKSEAIEERIVEYTMNFIDVPNKKEVLEKISGMSIREITGVSFDEANGKMTEKSAAEILKEQGMISIEKVINFQQSQGTVQGSEYFKLIYEGKDSEKNTLTGHVFIKRSSDSFDIIDATTGNSIIPHVHPASANIYQAQQNLIKTGDSGTMYIMTLNGITFNYTKNKSGIQGIQMIKDGVSTSMGYNDGLEFLYNLHDASSAASNLIKSSADNKYMDHTLNNITVKDKSVDVSEVLRLFLRPLLESSSDKNSFTNKIKEMFTIDSNNRVENGVLVISKKKGSKNSYNILTEVADDLKIVSSAEASNTEKYIKIYDFTGRNVDNLYNLISVNSKGLKS